MKSRMNWKRFWTLNRHHAEGFTLVELIVVIAILAILGGVAVPAYSGYVKKANMGADQTLISEIEHALTLAYYNGDITDGETGALVLMNPNAEYSVMCDEGTDFALAMEKAFGLNWTETVTLKYDGWGVKNMTLSAEEAKTVINSNFVQKYTPNELMNQVQIMTDAVKGLNLDVNGQNLTVYGLFDYGTDKNAVDDVVHKYYGEDKSWEDITDPTEKSNLLVLAAASSINGETGAAASSVLTNYAAYAAFAAENPAFNEKYNAFQASLSNIDSDSNESEIDQIRNAYDQLKNDATGCNFDEWKNTVESNGKTKFENSVAAFQTIMKGVDNAMEDNGDAILGELDNANLFTTGVGSELYKDFLNAANSSTGMLEDEGDFVGVNAILGLIKNDEAFHGSVAIWYTVVAGNLYIDTSLPVKY